ncbi:hypothetical protein BABINDRAFT_160167 [Babjeviella inositovora NRRL Y-12698]|uniref:Glucose-induced degradation protein 4 n=1 Tax=Babjeviella inositovora NRRL Y-12698 TaxID=984486 RepID=A0A1E3QWD3_9ASCO|nr:uncharacterized protein BABINDRAFT_160167 [Babjeviella inositovora NRRL Y-12698]ODQ81950.1 hypothetical protein BABINDRAFT_160167 [Babjeviella inositovora NRRL Y-12698]
MPTPSATHAIHIPEVDPWKLQGIAASHDEIAPRSEMSYAATEGSSVSSSYDHSYLASLTPSISRLSLSSVLDNENTNLETKIPFLQAAAEPSTFFGQAQLHQNASWIKYQPILPDAGYMLRPARQASNTSFLKANSTFMGSQQSRQSAYEVSVLFKQVDLSQNCLSGYLSISGLTEGYPEIITYFEAEIIGCRTNEREAPVSFLTNRHEEWGSSDRVDIQHWLKFPSFMNLIQSHFDVDIDTSGESVTPEMITQLVERMSAGDIFDENIIYMRWKEKFLVPDAKITDITGASFSGFYYVCFDQRNGSISGLYFHKTTDSFQQLELSHIPDRGVGGSYVIM